MKIVCLGDSLTYGHESPRDAAWPALVARKTGAIIRNRGVNGMTTGGMSARFPLDVEAENAAAVMLMGGANDILSGHGGDEPYNNIAAMAHRAAQTGIRPLIGVPTPFFQPIREDWAAMADFCAAAPVYDDLAERLRDLCAGRGYAAVDFRAGLDAYVKETGVTPRSLYVDGLHVNEAGHRVFAAVFASALQECGLVSHQRIFP